MIRLVHVALEAVEPENPATSLAQLDVGGTWAFPIARAIEQHGTHRDSALLDEFLNMKTDELTLLVDVSDSGLKGGSQHGHARSKVDAYLNQLGPVDAMAAPPLIILVLPTDDMLEKARSLLRRGCSVVCLGVAEQLPPILSICVNEKTCWYRPLPKLGSATQALPAVLKDIEPFVPTCAVYPNLTMGLNTTTPSVQHIEQPTIDNTSRTRSTTSNLPEARVVQAQGTLEFEVVEQCAGKDLPHWLANKLVGVLRKISKLRSCPSWSIRSNRVIITFGESDNQFLHRQLRWLLGLGHVRVNGCAGVSHVVAHPSHGDAHVAR